MKHYLSCNTTVNEYFKKYSGDLWLAGMTVVMGSFMSNTAFSKPCKFLESNVMLILEHDMQKGNRAGRRAAEQPSPWKGGHSGTLQPPPSSFQSLSACPAPSYTAAERWEPSQTAVVSCLWVNLEFASLWAAQPVALCHTKILVWSTRSIWLPRGTTAVGLYALVT